MFPHRAALCCALAMADAAARAWKKLADFFGQAMCWSHMRSSLPDG